MDDQLTAPHRATHLPRPATAWRGSLILVHRGLVERVDALVEALEAQHRIGQQVQPASLSLDTCCRGWTVRDVMNHSIGVTLKFTDFATGLTDRPRTPRGDLIGRNHRSALRSSADAAQAAWHLQT